MSSVAHTANKAPQLLESILDELEKLGHKRTDLFSAAGIDTGAESLESGLSAIDRSTLFNYACCRLAAEAGHRDSSVFVRKSVTDMLMYCVITCRNLHEVIDRTTAFCAVVESIGIVLKLSRNGQQAELAIDIGHVGSERSSLLLTLAAMSTFYNLFSWMIASDLPLDQVGLRYAKPNEHLPVGPLSGQSIRYQCSGNHFRFPASWLPRPVARTYEQLTQVLDYFPANLLTAGAGNNPLAARVTGIIQLSLTGEVPPVTADIVAQLVNLSPATLRRKLRDENTGFAQLFSQCQQTQAQHCLKTQVPIKAIAVQLGFSDDRAFRRAFKRWCGQTPTEFRQHYHARQKEH